MAEILVVDDEVGIRELLSEILGDEGHTVLLADSAQQARDLRNAQPIDLVLLDIWMPDTDGVTLLREWAGSGKLTMPVIMMSGHATVDTAVEATRIGAIDFLEKPITLQKLLRAVQSGLSRAAAPHAGVTPAPGVRPQGMAVAATLAVPESAEAAGLPVVGLVPPELSPVPQTAAPIEEPPVAGRLLVRELALDLPLREARDAFERTYFEHHLLREQGSMTRVAERTGLERTHLYRKLKQLGIDLARGAWRKNAN